MSDTGIPGSARRASPIHSATVNGRMVWLFPSPLDGPDLPWCDLGELLAACEYDADAARELIDWYCEHWPEHVSRVDGGGEGKVIASHFLATYLLNWLREGSNGARPIAAWQAQYGEAVALAFAVQHARLPRAEAKAAAQMAALRHATGGSA